MGKQEWLESGGNQIKTTGPCQKEGIGGATLSDFLISEHQQRDQTRVLMCHPRGYSTLSIRMQPGGAGCGHIFGFPGGAGW